MVDRVDRMVLRCREVFPAMTFATIVMDPPWPEHGGGQSKRGADRHYTLLPVRDMYPVITLSGVWQPSNNAHLYMWATNNYLPDGLRLMADLGFRYVTNVVWKKPHAGLGKYFRGKHEICLFGVRGEGYAVRSVRKDLESCYEWPRRAHSQKPVEFFDLVEDRSHGPYLEMFARSPRDGWTVWGNECSTVMPMSQPG